MAERVTALNADVEWHANTGKAEVDIERLRRQFHDATSAMSTEALKAASAQDRLDRALAKHGPNSKQARDAEISLRRVMDETTVAANRQSGALAREERQIGRLGRGALTGSGALRGLGRSVAFASSSFLGGYGLIFALRKTIDAASTLQEETEKTSVVFGGSAKSVQEWSRHLALSFGVSEEAALQAAGTFGNMLRPLHFGEQAAATMSKRLVELAADMASFNNASPAEVLQALSSGLAGQVRPLRQYGVFLSEARIKEEAYADGIAKRGKELSTAQKVQASYNIILKDTKQAQGDVARNTESLSVAQSKANAELEQAEATIGNDLRPQLAHLFTDTAKYLDKVQRTGELQRKVNTIVKDGAQVAHGLAEGFQAVHTAAEPLIDLFGGVEGTAKAMIEAFAVYKLLKIAGAIRGLGLQARFSRREITLLNETPVLPKGVPGATAPIGGAGRGGGRFVGVPFGAAAAVAATVLTIPNAGGGGDTGSREKRYPHVYNLIQRAASGQKLSAADALALTVLGGYSFANAPLDKLARAERILAGLPAGQSPIGENALGNQPPATTSATPATHHPPRPHGFHVPGRFLVDQARAAAEGTQSDVILADKAELAYVRAQIKAGHLNKQGLIDAYNEEDRLENEVDSLVKARRKAAADRAKKRKAARDKAAAEALRLSNRDHTPDVIDRFLKTRAKNAAYKNKAAAKAAAGGEDFYADAAANFRAYGSNIGDVLSGQDARGLLAQIALLLGQGNRDRNDHAKKASGGRRYSPGQMAGVLADVGAWS